MDLRRQGSNRRRDTDEQQAAMRSRHNEASRDSEFRRDLEPRREWDRRQEIVPRRDIELPREVPRANAATTASTRRAPEDIQRPVMIEPRREPEQWRDSNNGWEEPIRETERQYAYQHNRFHRDEDVPTTPGNWAMAYYNAVRFCSFRDLKHLVNQHRLDLNAPFGEAKIKSHMDLSPAHIVCLKGFTGMLDWLKENDVYLDQATTLLKRTPLHFAVLNNKVACFNRLLFYGVNTHAKDTFGNTALAYAAEDDRPYMLRTLLLPENRINRKTGVDDVNVQDITMKTPLMKAVRNNRADSVRLLLQTGARLDMRDRNQDTALHFAVRKSTFRLGALLLVADGCDVNVQNMQGTTPLMEAVYYNNKEATFTLLRAKCNVNCRDNRTGDTALHLSIRRDYVDIVEQLLATCRVSRVFSYNEHQAIYDVIISQRMEMFKLFVRQNYDLDKPIKMLFDGNGGETTIDVALKHESFAILEILAEIGYCISTKPAKHEIPAYPAYIDSQMSPDAKSLRTMEHCRNVEQFFQKIGHVRKLKACCRRVIRSATGYGIKWKLDNLGIPTMIKDYILLADMNLQPLI